MDAVRIWRGDYTKPETERRLYAGLKVSSHCDSFHACRDTTGMVREILNHDKGRSHIVDYVSVLVYVESLSEWNTPDRMSRSKDILRGTPTEG